MNDGTTTEQSLSAPAPQHGGGAKAAPKPAPAGKRRKRRRKPRSANGRVRRIVLYSVGFAFILLGIAGLFLPILQGILFLLIGVIVLAQVSPRARLWRQRFRAKARSRYPQWTGKLEEAEHRAKRWIIRVLKTNNDNRNNNDKRA
jgi:uncharacterized membrane protein YbaN (DUF454 family)